MPQLSLFDPVSIPLTKGYVALVDPADADLAAFKWCADANAYPVRKAQRKLTYLHRIVLARKLGRDLISGEVTDHIDGNALNNRRDNLRVATPKENRRNTNKPSTNTSGYKGVTWHKLSGHWVSQIRIDGRHKHLGCFDSAEQAHAAYCEAAIKYHGAFANFGATPDLSGGDE